MSAAGIALHRFGLGARPGDPAPADPRRWLVDQLDRYDPRPAAIAAAPTSTAAATRVADFYDRRRSLRAARPMATDPPVPPPMSSLPQATAPEPATDPLRDARREAGREARADYAASVAARTAAALIGEAPFVERLVHFWANHFAVSADKLPVIALAGSLEFEAIRPHVLGRFADMLAAVERHPAMLVYLDQAVSVGPDSQAGRRIAARGRRTVGLNENLAREIMELHTLGVRTGYTQADVTELARALTGRTVAGLGREPGLRADAGAPGSFVFAPAVHEPGERTILGRRYPATGEPQAAAVLADLAAHPATATHIATKLARHFAGDVPPPALVERLAAAFRRSGGDLPTVYRALIASPEAWVAAPVKFRTPWEWSIAAYRALGVRRVQPAAIVGLMNQLGQPVWKPGQPVGYDDIAGAWAGPDAVMRRVEAAERFAGRAPATDARVLAAGLFPDALSPATRQAIDRAESPAQALALLLVSPEMMRR